jgi:hypothetical protein
MIHVSSSSQNHERFRKLHPATWAGNIYTHTHTHTHRHPETVQLVINQYLPNLGLVWSASSLCFAEVWLLWLAIFFSLHWGLNSGPTPWATPPALFWNGFFQDRDSQTICPCWLWIMILIYDSWVARTTGVNHRCPAETSLFVARIL